MVKLKLTDNQMMFLDISTDISKLNKGFEEEYVYLCKNSAKRMDIDISDNEYLIQDVDKFRKFLNDKILGAEFYRKTNPRKYYLMKADNVVFKSVLSKLDKEVNK